MTKAYRESVVAFIDVLGFADKISASTRDVQVFRAIQTMLKDTGSIARRLNSDGKMDDHLRSLRTQMFSDTVVISSDDLSEDAVTLVTKMAMLFQVNAILDGFLLRGAIVVGSLYEDGDVMFGPAIVEAYGLERLANWPRVVVGPSVLDYVTSDFLVKGRGDYLLQADDGLFYLDYLTSSYVDYIVGESRPRHRAPTSPPRLLLLHHKKALEKGAAALGLPRDVGILSKYFAAALYHNTVIDRIHSMLTRPATESRGRPSLTQLIERRVDQVGPSVDSRIGTPRSQVIDNLAEAVRKDRNLVDGYRIDIDKTFPEFHAAGRD